MGIANIPAKITLLPIIGITLDASPLERAV
jgi:hypothetical protein